MKQHEREFFVALIRCGNAYITYNDIELVIKPPTIEQQFRAEQVYQKAYDEAYLEGIMTQDETEEWMIEHELWTPDDIVKLKGLEKDYERLKIEIYNARNDSKLARSIRYLIRGCEKSLQEILNFKNQYYNNTCEGLASLERTSYLIKKTTYSNDVLYDFDETSLISIISEWNNTLLSEKNIRELARNDPWKSLWICKDSSPFSLFKCEKDSVITFNQKSLLVWSQMYDNIQESLDCPTSDVINDDDMLDGWFIVQSKKRDKERAEKEFEDSTNEKIKNSPEVFVMSKSDKDRNRINSMNDVNSKNIQRQRNNLIKRKGTVEQQQFYDEQINMQSKQNQAFKTHVRGGK